MSADVAPEDWIASYAYASSTLSIPLASITGLMAADCDPVTGDIRKIIRCLLDTLIAAQNSGTPAANPTKSMTLSSSAQSQNGIAQSYSAQFVGSAIAVTLAAP